MKKPILLILLVTTLLHGFTKSPKVKKGFSSAIRGVKKTVVGEKEKIVEEEPSELDGGRNECLDQICLDDRFISDVRTALQSENKGYKMFVDNVLHFWLKRISKENPKIEECYKFYLNDFNKFQSQQQPVEEVAYEVYRRFWSKYSHYKNKNFGYFQKFKEFEYVDSYQGYSFGLPTRHYMELLVEYCNMYKI